MKVWHITLSSSSRAVLFPGEAAMRAAVRCLAAVAGLLLFCVVDDHVHVVVACDAARLRWVRGGLVRALSTLSGQRLVAHVKAVATRAHLNRLVAYLLRQVEHHGLRSPAARWTGSCYFDLVGARCVGSLRARLQEVLPRFRSRDLHDIVGLPAARVVEADAGAVRRAGAQRIVLAAAAAVAADPLLADHSAVVVLAKRASVHVADQAGLHRAELAHALGHTRQRLSQLAREPIDPAILRATRLQLTLDELVPATREPARAS